MIVRLLRAVIGRKKPCLLRKMAIYKETAYVSVYLLTTGMNISLIITHQIKFCLDNISKQTLCYYLSHAWTHQTNRVNPIIIGLWNCLKFTYLPLHNLPYPVIFSTLTLPPSSRIWQTSTVPWALMELRFTFYIQWHFSRKTRLE